MQYMTFNEGDVPFKLCILIKESSLEGKKKLIKIHYIDPLKKLGINPEDIVVIGLRYIDGKALKKTSLEWINNNLVSDIQDSGVKAVAVADTTYFEYLTNNKASKYIQAFCKSSIDGLEGMNIVPIINYKATAFNNALKIKSELALKVIPDAVSSFPTKGTARQVKNQYYPNTLGDIRDGLNSLLEADELSVDIEAFSLEHTEAGIGTISFSVDQDTCLAFKVQYRSLGKRELVPPVYKLLKQFFIDYRGTMFFHRGSYDIKILIYELFMDYDSDYEGMVQGIKCFQNIEDTMLMVYVCTNNTVQNTLNLKDNTMEFAGNYAIDIKDISIHEPDVVLEYNGRDTCNTMYLYDKYIDKIHRENLMEAYLVLRDFILVGIQLELRGFPMSMTHSKALHKEIGAKIQALIASITGSELVTDYVEEVHKEAVFTYNLESKTRVVHVDTYPRPEFNPGSDTQVAKLIHEHLGVEVLAKTKTGLPSLTTDALIELRHHLQRDIDEEDKKCKIQV